MTYFVYTPTRGRKLYPVNWRFHSKHDHLAGAEASAVKLCDGGNVVTEPGNNLDRGFFGIHQSNNWRAMIQDHDIHAKHPLYLSV